MSSEDGIEIEWDEERTQYDYEFKHVLEDPEGNWKIVVKTVERGRRLKAVISVKCRGDYSDYSCISEVHARPGLGEERMKRLAVNKAMEKMLEIASTLNQIQMKFESK